jgi:hypothetical protein
MKNFLYDFSRLVAPSVSPKEFFFFGFWEFLRDFGGLVDVGRCFGFVSKL